MKPLTRSLALAATLLTVAGCDRAAEADHDHPAAATQAAPPAAAGGRVEIPATVRQNLGITFAKAEYRRVAGTLRAPGRFELPPTARHEARAPFGGRVELLVKQYDTVKAGQVVARISSPDWHRLQLELEEDAADVTRATAELAIAQQSLVEGQQRVKLLEQRVATLERAEVRRSELEAELAAARNAAPRLEAEVAAKAAALDAARHHLPLAEAAAAAQLGLTREQLLEPVDTPAGRRSRWQATALVEVRAASDGIVDTVTVPDGGRVDALGAILTTLDARQLRFRGVALQADLHRLRDGLPATVISASDRGTAPLPPVRGTLRVAPDANADERTIDLIVTPGSLEAWCRPGVAAVVEIAAAQADEELAIPAAAVIQDGLAKVFFRRDRKNPDVAIRTEADLGATDGRWVIVQSGLAEGDEVVVDGLYELKLATSQAGGAVKGGHFHADGTFHADGEPEPGSGGKK